MQPLASQYSEQLAALKVLIVDDENTMRKVERSLLQAIGELRAGPDIVGAKARDEVMRGLRTLHVARHGRRGRHFLMFRTQKQTIEIVRILHDSMELSRHLPSNAKGGEE